MIQPKPLWDTPDIDAKIAAIREYFGAGYSTTQTAKIFKTSRNAMVGFCDRNNIVLPGARPEHEIPEKTRGRLRINKPGKPAGKAKTPKRRNLSPPCACPKIDNHHGAGASDDGLIRFADSKHNQCTFIPGDPSAPGGALCCGQPVETGKPYCTAHCNIAYVRKTKEEA